MEPLLRLGEVELRPADDDIATVSHVVCDQCLETQGLGPVVHECDVDDTVCDLHVSLLEQVLEDDVRDGILVELDDDTHTVPVGLVPEIGYTLYLLVLDPLGDLLDEHGLVHLVGNLVDDDPLLAVAHLLEVGVCPDLEPSTSGLVCGPYPGKAVDRTSGGEIRTLDELHELLEGRIRVVDGVRYRVTDLPQVVRGHLGGHSDGDSVGTVHQQVGELGREDGRLLEGTIVVVHHVHGLLVEVGHEVTGHLGHPGLGVTHSCGTVTVDGTEVTLSVHERIPE